MRRQAEKGNLDENLRKKETYVDEQATGTGRSGGGFKKRRAAKGNKRSLVDDGE